MGITMKLYLKIITVLFVFSSCSSAEKQEKVFKQTFNSEELSYLNAIEKLFYGQICKEDNQTDLNNCFKNYSREALEVFSVDDDAIFPTVSYEDIWTFIENSSDEDLGLIWEKRPSNQRLSLKLDSKFFELLKTKKPEENYLINRIIQQGDIMPGDIVHLFSHPEKYNLNDRVVRLTIAIDIVTQINREKEKTTPNKTYEQ